MTETVADMFGNDIGVGDEIIYLNFDHGWTIRTWAVVESIEFVERRYHQHKQLVMWVNRHRIEGKWDSTIEKKRVRLTGPTLLKVGEPIPGRVQ